MSRKPMLRIYLSTKMIAATLILSACQNLTPPDRNELVRIPESWDNSENLIDSSVEEKHLEDKSTFFWSRLIKNTAFQNLASLALDNNPTLKQQKLAIDIAKAELNASGTTLYVPNLNLGLNAEHSETDSNSENELGGDTEALATENNSRDTYSLSANLSYELNIWGQLSDAKRASSYTYAAQRADYQQAQQNILFSLSSAWFDLLSANELINLFEDRLSNQQENLNAIESRYRSGINSALDVYLARNNVAQEKSNVADQRAILKAAKRAIQILIQNYPNADLLNNNDLPTINSVLFPNLDSNNKTPNTETPNTETPNIFLEKLLPASLLTHKPSLQSAWLSVLIQNADVAIAHKARFPSLTLNASARQTADSLSNLTDSGIFSWSIGASLLQPLLSGGRLKAAEKIARLQLEQAELEYINTVYNAFNTIENALTQQATLREQLKFTQAAATNAVYAEELSFEQYQKGIVTFATVLESQRRSFDSQAQVISLKTQIAKNSALLLSEFVADIDFETHRGENQKTLDINSSAQAD